MADCPLTGAVSQARGVGKVLLKSHLPPLPPKKRWRTEETMASAITPSTPQASRWRSSRTIGCSSGCRERYASRFLSKQKWELQYEAPDIYLISKSSSVRSYPSTFFEKNKMPTPPIPRCEPRTHPIGWTKVFAFGNASFIIASIVAAASGLSA